MFAPQRRGAELSPGIFLLSRVLRFAAIQTYSIIYEANAINVKLFDQQYLQQHV